MTDELIERFFEKRCTPAEAAQVADYLQKHPDIAGRYLGEQEWNSAGAEEEMEEGFWEQEWNKINAGRKKGLKLVLLKRFAAAASLAAITASIFYYAEKAGPSPVVMHRAASVAAPVSVTKYNSLSQTQLVVLPDSSVVALAPGAEVHYDVPFAGNKRDIYLLQGEASFIVAKNKEKPFTVYAGALATTALGTEFRVKYDAQTINVKLLHGKVVIRCTDIQLKGWHKNVYLVPGQQMNYQRGSSTVSVGSMYTKAPAVASARVIKKDNGEDTTFNLTFNGTSMPLVLNRLADYYKVKIIFDKTEVDNMSFTGVITKSDSLQTVLKVIAQMNSLNIINNEDSIVVHKKQD